DRNFIGNLMLRPVNRLFPAGIEFAIKIRCRFAQKPSFIFHFRYAMLTLDRYLLRQFFQIFAICFCSLAGLYIVIDAFGNLDDFMKFAGEHGNLWSIMGSYYGFQTIGFFDRTSGMLTLIAAMFTIALFQRYNEFTALQAAGIPKWRIIKPIVIAVLIMAA